MEVEHTITNEEDAEISLHEEIGYGPSIQFDGGNCVTRIYLSHKQLQELTDELCLWGYSCSDKEVE